MPGTHIDRSVEWDTSPRRRGPSTGRTRRRGRTYPLKWVIVLLAAVGALLIGGPYVFFNVIEGKAPAELHLPPAGGLGPGGSLAPGPLSGTWTVGSGSEAGYRVQEMLFGQQHTAVGRTPKVTGGMVISGTSVTAADFTVDLRSVTSDQRSRDVQFDGFIMRTFDHPDARFQLTRAIQLGTVPATGVVVTETATGDLTMRGVTRSVTFPVRAERAAGGIDVKAEIPIVFSRWYIPNPSFAVARVGSTGTLEVLLHLVPGAAQSSGSTAGR